MKYVQADRWTRARPMLVGFMTCLLAFALFSISSTGQTTSPQQPRQDTSPQSTKPTPTPTPKKAGGPPELGEPPPPPVLRQTPRETPNPEGQEIGEGDVVKVDTSLVNLNVRVIDRNNRPIGDLRQEDFRVYEDSIVQPVEFFSKEEVPISYGLAVDNSGSMRSQIDKVIEAAKSIIESNKPNDETFLMRFIDSDKIQTVQDFTSNKDLLLDGMDSMNVEGGQTAVIDAVYLAAQHVAQYKKGNDLSDRRRRALIVVTDGEDRASYFKQDQLFAQLREEDVQIYVIGFIGELEKEGGFIRKSPHDKAVNLIERFAKETGGRAFFPTSLSELPGIAQEITRDMRTQYVIGYSPTNKARDGSYRRVRVTIGDTAGSNKLIALTRPGYTAPLEGSKQIVKPAPAKKP